MPEARIERFRGFASDLPNTRGSAFAEDNLNVYEDKLGQITRRPGVRRLVEYKAEVPIQAIANLVEPGGEQVGAFEVLLQSRALVGESRPRSTVVSDTPPTIDGVVQPLAFNYAPIITEVGANEPSISSPTDWLMAFAIRGANFLNSYDNPLTVTVTELRFFGPDIVTPIEWGIYNVRANNLSYVDVWAIPPIGVFDAPEPGATMSFKVTTSEGLEATWGGVLTW